MNRKHNPMVSLAALVLLAVVLVMACAGCTAEALTGGRFTYARDGFGPGPICYIITDTHTGVQYLFCKAGTYNGTGAGLCVLQPGEG